MAKKRDFRVMLKEIASFLKRNDAETEKLWNVLTALRGPDSGDEGAKRATTCVIRHAVGLEGGGAEDLATIQPDSEEAALIRNRDRLDVWHFRCHAQKAFHALGLSWDSFNPPVKPLKKRTKKI